MGRILPAYSKLFRFNYPIHFKAAVGHLFTKGAPTMASSSFSPPDSVKERRAPVKTAGVLVIGDEILKGHVSDTNSHFLSKRFHALGVKLCKITVVSDNIPEIAKEVKQFSKEYDIVITTGGIGPTHDDVTYEGVAAAFDDTIEFNETMVSYWSSYYKGDIRDKSNPLLKMAHIPKSAKIVVPKVPKTIVSSGIFPVTVMSNVFIYPGIPKYLEAAFTAMEEEYFNPGTHFHYREIYLNVFESVIVKILNEAVKKFPSTEIGSYPVIDSPCYRTRLTLESLSESEVEGLEAFLKSNLDPEWIVPVERVELPHEMVDGLHLEKMGPLGDKITASLQLIRKYFEEFPSEGIFLSFNGGKDCTALLHLLRCAAAHESVISKHPKLKAVYFRGANPFPEAETFIYDIAKRYSLELIVAEGRIRPTLEKLYAENPSWKAVFMGTRRSDPSASNLQPVQPTDEGWPPLLRINPILDWSYKDVWTFLRELHIPYCSLYDQGYTSLGHVENTKPNPALKVVNADGSVSYQPAYMLSDECSERDGRN